jgi:lipoprotein NlpD
VVERGKGTPPASQGAIPAKDLYTVKRGDTLYNIAQAHGIDPRELAALNNIENPSRIYVGQQLRLRVSSVGVSAGGDAVTQPIGAGVPVVEQRSLDGMAPVAAASPNTSQMKVEPKAGKVPYSDEAWAQAQREQASPLMVKAEPPKPEPKAEPKPEVRAEPKPAAEPSAGGDDVPWTWPANGGVISQFSESGAKGIGIGGKAGDAVVAAGDGKVVYAGTGLRGYGQLIIVKHNATFLSAYAHNQKLLVKEGQPVSKGQKIAEMGNTDADQVKLHFEIRRQGKPVDPMKYLPQR